MRTYIFASIVCICIYPLIRHCEHGYGYRNSECSYLKSPFFDKRKLFPRKRSMFRISFSFFSFFCLPSICAKQWHAIAMKNDNSTMEFYLFEQCSCAFNIIQIAMVRFTHTQTQREMSAKKLFHRAMPFKRAKSYYKWFCVWHCNWNSFSIIKLSEPTKRRIAIHFAFSTINEWEMYTCTTHSQNKRNEKNKNKITLFSSSFR